PDLVREHREKFQVFLPATHERFPFTGVFTGFLTVGLWYSCTSQHIVQRVLAAKDEYHARVGVVGAGFLHILTPFFFTLPGVIAFALHPELRRGDAAYLTLGLLWRRATATAAITTVALGFPFSAFLTLYAFPHLEFLRPYNTYQHPAFVSWVFCMAVMVVTSLLTAPPPPEKTEGIIWSA